MITQGRLIVRVPGKPQPFAAATWIVQRLTVTALETNTQKVAIGDEFVSAAYGSETGLHLYPQQQHVFENVDLSLLHMDVVTADEGVNWLAETVE